MCDLGVMDVVDDGDASTALTVVGGSEDADVVGLAEGGVLACVVVDVV